MRIVLTGGGSGGHLFPLIAVADKLKQKLGPEAEFMYIGSGARLEKEVISRQGYAVKFVMSGKLRRYFSLQNIIDIFKLPIGIIQSLWILLWYMPDVIFSKGGYVAIPVVLAAWFYRIPIFMHESDSVPGMANRFLGKLADRVAVAYPSAEEFFLRDRTALVGNPIRQSMTEGDAYALRSKLELTESRKTILVIGGSQGAKVVNDAVVRMLPELLERYQIIHQTGGANYESVVRFAAEQGIKAGHQYYYPIAFADEGFMADAYAAADLVISRAGANSIAEIAANGKPAILIPLEGSANDHQRMNAYALARIGAAIVLEETNLGKHIVLQKIGKIFEEEDLRNALSKNIRSFHHPRAAEVIANAIIEIAA